MALLEIHCQLSSEAIQHSKDNLNNNKSKHPSHSLPTFQHSKERVSNLAVTFVVLKPEPLLLPRIIPLHQIKQLRWLADRHWSEQMENSDNLNNKLK